MPRHNQVTSRNDLPLYAKYEKLVLSGQQVKLIWRRGLPETWKVNLSDRHYVEFAQTKDGQWWANLEPPNVVFWYSRWYKVPKLVGQRVEKLRDFVKGLR